MYELVGVLYCAKCEGWFSLKIRETGIAVPFSYPIKSDRRPQRGHRLAPSVRFRVLRKDNFQCHYCGRKPPITTLEIDHVVPVSIGGTDDEENLVVACFECNSGKGGKRL